ncbi:MAG: hypothetical protein KDE14_11710, partial [Rhodobacteraceae bacterium]|nr:hypothetical protein [Paracoccaceae bacterium]
MTPEPGSKPPPKIVVKIMGLMAKMAPPDPSGENSAAVRAFRRVDAVLDVLSAGPLRRRLRSPLNRPAWPQVAGAYAVGDRMGAAAICTLSSNDLYGPLAKLPGVAIAGRLVTVNLGIEKMILNVTANPSIRALILCGKESPVFHTAQGIKALMTGGVDTNRRILGAEGHLPVLGNIPAERIARFREQVTLIDAVGVTDTEKISALVASTIADAAKKPVLGPMGDLPAVPDQAFKPIESGGHREPISHDPKGFFVISIDRAAGVIVCRHYLADATPAHEVKARSAERILLALIRENLISQMSHAGYLGGELAKAEAALRLGLIYEQDKVLAAG